MLGFKIFVIYMRHIPQLLWLSGYICAVFVNTQKRERKNLVKMIFLVYWNRWENGIDMEELLVYVHINYCLIR